MIDFHTHCLPNIDDGAENIEESLRMLSYSFAQGVKTCIATPHCFVHSNDDISKFCDKRKESLLSIKNKLEKDKYPDILLGAEIFLDNDISRYKDIDKLCIENTNLLLMEFPVGTVDEVVSENMYSLNVKGITPVIAHLDRCPDAEKIMEMLSDIKIIYQLNATRFLSFSGRRTVKKITESGNTFIVGSDMHNMTTRVNNMQKAYTIAQKKFKGNNWFLSDIEDIG